jgi:hypothetical protein
VGIFRNYLKSIKQSTLVTLLSLLSSDWVTDWSNTELTATLINGSRISFFGCDDPDRIGSVELSYAFIDEVHEISDEAYTMIRGRLSLDPKVWQPYANSPYLTNIRQLICAANPKSKSHHLYKRFFTDRDSHKVYYGNTLENHYLPTDYVDNLISAYARPGVSVSEVREKMAIADRENRLSAIAALLNSHGRRNLLGLWGSSDQQWYPDYELAVVSECPSQFEYVIAGIDWGYNHPRYLKIGLSNGKWFTFDYWSPSKITPDDFVAGVAERSDKVDYTYVPHDQPGLTRQLKRLVPRVRKGKMAVLPGISAIASNLGKSLFFVAKGEDYPIFESEMTGYERKLDSQSGEPLDVPNKVNDHFPDSCRIAFYTHLSKSRDSDHDEIDHD